MLVKQISVFLENTTGSLARLTGVLRENDINLLAVSVADTEHFGVMRFIVSDTDRVFDVVRSAGYVARVNDVVAVSVQDAPGGLDKALTILEKRNIAVEYLYSMASDAKGGAPIIMRLSDTEAGARALAEGGVASLAKGV